MTYKLFIDDLRDPVNPSEWIIARSSYEAVQAVKNNGIPSHIAFDHDLGGEDTSMKFINWFIDYLIFNQDSISLPKDFEWSVHSQNPVGAMNINTIMKHFKKYYSENYYSEELVK